MKISPLEKILLGVTAAFLLGTAGYFLGVRSTAEPFRVDVQYTLSPEPSAEAAAVSGISGTEKININTADAAQLEGLPGVGEKRAADIVADREKNGPFRIPEDLTRVKGIGQGTLEGLLEYITVE